MKTVHNFVNSETHSFINCVRSFLPQYTVVPFSQIRGQNFHCTVKDNDSVKEGQIIAAPDDENKGALIHSPIPGKICGIINCSLPDGQMGRAIRIRLTGGFSFLGKKQNKNNWRAFSPKELCDMFSRNGIINTFSNSQSLSMQIEKCQKENKRILVARLFDEDPSRMTDSFVYEKYTAQVVEGIMIIAKALDAEGIVFAISKYAEKDLENLNSDSKFPYMKISVDVKKYPCGFKQNLIQSIKKEAKNLKKDIFINVNTKGLFVDSETAYSVYEAVVLGIPVVERFVHVTGSCLRSAGMFKVRIGTPIQSLTKQCGGFKRAPSKIIINGMITGFAISNMETPVTKLVKSVMFVSANELDDQTSTQCIRCGKCRIICPEGIFPDLIFRHKTGGKPIGKDLVKTANLCSGCCLCNSICPARLPLSQTISLLKDNEI
ncbi:MAG: hypothetical protein WCQ67_00925 [Treponema sp.]